MLEMIKGGTTVLYVSHSLESIKDLCDKEIGRASCRERV